MNVFEKVNYSPFLGQLVWTNDGINMSKGCVAGGIHKRSGYRVLNMGRKSYRVHRLIYEMFNGPIPDKMLIDHINDNRDCNYIWNLRLASHAQNQQNVKLQSNNTSGVKGVSWHTNGCWIARLTVKGKRIQKFFDDIEVAEGWIKWQRSVHHGEFANHG